MVGTGGATRGCAKLDCPCCYFLEPFTGYFEVAFRHLYTDELLSRLKAGLGGRC